MTKSATALRSVLNADKAPLDDRALARATAAVADSRHRWGWVFGKRAQIMAIDSLLATAAIRAYLEAECGER